MIKVPYDKTIEDNALAQANLMIKNELYDRFGLPDSKRIENARVGMLGEICFQKLLESKGVPFILDVKDFTNRSSDEFDVKIGKYLVDIKVAKQSTKNNPHDGWTYGYPAEQHPQTKDVVVIGLLQENEKQVCFYGWTTGLYISQQKVVDKNSFANYKYKVQNHEFKFGALNTDFDDFLGDSSKYKT